MIDSPVERALMQDKLRNSWHQGIESQQGFLACSIHTLLCMLTLAFLTVERLLLSAKTIAADDPSLTFYITAAV